MTRDNGPGDDKLAALTVMAVIPIIITVASPRVHVHRRRQSRVLGSCIPEE